MKQLISLLILIVLSASASKAQSLVELWSAEHPAPHQSTLTGSETLPDSDGRVSNITKATMSVFLPEKSRNTGQAVIICPGGGYWLLTTHQEGSHYAELLAQNGITGIVLKYRVPNGVHFIPLEDAQRAMELTIANAAAWGVDTSKIGVMGFSAGGHLAASLATQATIRPAFAVLFYPVISMRKGITHEGSREQLIGNKPLREYYSAELNVDSKTPPTLIFHCADDRAVSIANSQLYCDALRANKIPHKMVTYPTGGHGWGSSDRLPEKQEMQKTLIDWLQKL